MMEEAHFDDAWPEPISKLELGILVIDGSGSMSEQEPGTGRSKARQVMHHLLGSEDSGERSLLSRLKSSTRAPEIQIAVLTFDLRARRRLAPTPVASIDERAIAFDPLAGHGQTTSIGVALTEAAKVAEEFLEGEAADIPRYVNILLLSDGREQPTRGKEDPLHPENVAAAIRRRYVSEGLRPKVIIAAAGYGGDADETMLKALVTEAPAGEMCLYRRVETGEQLRDFFLQSIAVVNQLTHREQRG